MSKKISVIGGDLRQLTLYKLFQEDGFDVQLYGFDKLSQVKSNTDISAVAKSDIIILPMPVTTDNVLINTVYSSKALKLQSIIDKIRPKTIVFGGQIKEELMNKLKEKNILYFDYLLREELAIKNAVATSEGAINIAITETPYTLNQSNCLVLGYGRIGKVLSKMLSALGVYTTVCARKLSDIALAQSLGLNAIHLPDLKNFIGTFDIIFNTIPYMVLDKNMLKSINPDALIIDLASKPGGVDFDVAKETELKVIWALSLPGKVAPATSGKIIKDTIVNILKELEV